LASISKLAMVEKRRKSNFLHIFISQINGEYCVSRRKIDRYACARFQHRAVCHHMIVNEGPITDAMVLAELEKHKKTGECVCASNVHFSGQSFLNPAFKSRYHSEDRKIADIKNMEVSCLIPDVPYSRKYQCALCANNSKIEDLFLFSKHLIGKGFAGRDRWSLSRAFSEIYLGGSPKTEDTLVHFGHVLEQCILDLWMSQLSWEERLDMTIVRRHIVKKISYLHLGQYGNHNNLVCCSRCFFNLSAFNTRTESIRDMINRKQSGISMRVVDYMYTLSKITSDLNMSSTYIHNFISNTVHLFPSLYHNTNEDPIDDRALYYDRDEEEITEQEYIAELQTTREE
jgi:hypothetical protein